jgi:hypothetical protein
VAVEPARHGRGGRERGRAPGWIAQGRQQAPLAIAAGTLGATQWGRLDRRLGRAETFLATAAADPTATRALKRAARRLGRVCRKLSG